MKIRQVKEIRERANAKEKAQELRNQQDPKLVNAFKKDANRQKGEWK